MSRHRTMRARCDSAMQDDDGEYGRSVEDQAFSPSMSSYMFQRDQCGNQIGNYMPRLNQQNDEEDEEFAENAAEDERSRRECDDLSNLTDSQHAEMLKMALTNNELERLYACLDKMHDVLGAGENPEAVLCQAALDSKFDPNSAIQRVIDASSSVRVASVNNNLQKEMNIASKGATTLQNTRETACTTTHESSLPLIRDVSTNQNVTKQKLEVGSSATALQSSLLTRVSVDGCTNELQPAVFTDSYSNSARPATPTNRSAKKRDKEESGVEKRVLNLQIAAQSGLRSDSPSRPLTRISSSNRMDSPCVTLGLRIASGEKHMRSDAVAADSGTGTKLQLNLVVIGHVDAGKSTLMGHLLHKLNVVSSKEVRRNEQDAKKAGKSSFSFAWILDQNAEERKRGITMDIAQTRFTTPHKDVTLLDAPGHKDFIPNMIVGAAQADAAVLVVNATRGEFESGFDAGGQTREHAILVRSCGIQQLVIAVNQLDKVDYSQARFDEIRSTLTTFLRTQIGYRDDDLRFVPVSGFSGENLITGPTDPRLVDWYKGPSLVDVIDSLRPSERATTKPFRMFLVDGFKPPSGAGLCVSGTVTSGICTVGDRLLLMPVAKPVTVKAIAKEMTSQSPDSGGEVQSNSTATSPLPMGFCAVETAYAGDSVTLTLLGVDPNTNERSAGWILCEPSLPIRVTQRIRAQIVILQTDTVVTRGMPIEAHVHSLCESASITKLLALLNRANGTVLQKRPKVLERGQTCLVELAFDRPVCVELYSEYKELGRIMLRHHGDTIAAGIIVDIGKLKLGNPSD